MREDGFTLVELMVAVAIIATLLTIGTLAFNSMTRKSAIEAQTKEIYADLMTARSEALYRKTSRSVIVTATQFTINDSAGTAVLQKTYKQTMAENNANVVTFGENGVADVPNIYCIGPGGNEAAIDSVIVSSTIILTGKRTGGACNSANIQAK
jgi:prepilin-type N-terminal cleavage/methylation domain-containing protein